MRDRLDMVVIDAIRPRSAVLVSRLEVGSRIDLCRTAVGRGGTSILSNLGMPELIAATPVQYIELAVAWASDRLSRSPPTTTSG